MLSFQESCYHVTHLYEMRMERRVEAGDLQPCPAGVSLLMIMILHCNLFINSQDDLFTDTHQDSYIWKFARTNQFRIT